LKNSYFPERFCYFCNSPGQATLLHFSKTTIFPGVFAIFVIHLVKQPSYTFQKQLFREVKVLQPRLAPRATTWPTATTAANTARGAANITRESRPLFFAVFQGEVSCDITVWGFARTSKQLSWARRNARSD